MSQHVFEDWVNNLVEQTNQVIEKTENEFFDVLEKKMRTQYKKIIDLFYSEYTPKTYNRQGENGLYGLLRISRDEDGMAYDFDPTKLSFRNGYNGENGLYDLVFRKGYHGGYLDKRGVYKIPWTNPVVEYNGDNNNDDGRIKPWQPEPWHDNHNIKHGWERAQKGTSPLREWNKFIDHYNRNECQKDLDGILNKYISQMNFNRNGV